MLKFLIAPRRGHTNGVAAQRNSGSAHWPSSRPLPPPAAADAEGEPSAAGDAGVELGSPLADGVELALVLAAVADGLCDADALGDEDGLGELLCAALVAGATLRCAVLGLWLGVADRLGSVTAPGLFGGNTVLLTFGVAEFAGWRLTSSRPNPTPMAASSIPRPTSSPRRRRARSRSAAKAPELANAGPGPTRGAPPG
jgi:hypothetical protein